MTPRLLGVLCLCACEPSLRSGEAVRKTLESQAASERPPEVRQAGDAARAAAARWHSEAGARLIVALDDAESRIALASESGAQPSRAIELFELAATRVAGAAAPLAEDAALEVRALLAQSRASAMALSAREPTTASPIHALKAVRRHQAGEGQPEAAAPAVPDRF